VTSDTNGHVRPTVFDSVPGQVLGHVLQSVGVALESYAVDDFDGRVVRVYGGPTLSDKVSHTDRLRFAYVVTLASECQRVPDDRFHPIERLEERIEMLVLRLLGKERRTP